MFLACTFIQPIIPVTAATATSPMIDSMPSCCACGRLADTS